MARIQIHIDVDDSGPGVSVLQEIQVLERIAASTATLPRLRNFLNLSAVRWVADRMRAGDSEDMFAHIQRQSEKMAVLSAHQPGRASDEVAMAKLHSEQMGKLIAAQRSEMVGLRAQINAQRETIKQSTIRLIKTEEIEKRAQEAVALAEYFQVQAVEIERRLNAAYAYVQNADTIPSSHRRGLGEILTGESDRKDAAHGVAMMATDGISTSNAIDHILKQSDLNPIDRRPLGPP